MFYKNLSVENLTTEFDGVIYVEEWKFSKDLKSIYQVSSFGRIKSIGRYFKTNGRWKPEQVVVQSENKYLRFHSKSVHRMVAKLFCANPYRKPQVNHIDTNKYNNFFKNLEWCTQSENNKHAVERSLCYQAQLKHLTFEDRAYIRNNITPNNRSELATSFGITEEHVYAIGTNRDTLFLPTIKIPRKTRKKHAPIFKPIIDLNTGVFYTSYELATLLGTTKKEICRMISEERKPNKTQYRYA